MPALPVEGDEDEDARPESDQELTIWQKVKNDFAVLCLDPHPQVAYTARPVLMRYLAAIAEGSLRGQHKNLEDVLRYVHSLHTAQAVKACCFFQKMAFDETPLKLKVSFGMDHTLETGRIVAVQSEWGMLIQDLTMIAHEDPSASYVFLRGHSCPQLKASDRETGESYACVLQACLKAPEPALLKMFGSRVLVAESDEAGANTRAMRMFSPQYDDVVTLHLYCLLHKIHNVASKTFSLVTSDLRGVARTLLVLHQPGVLHKMKKALSEEIAKQFEYEPVDVLRPMSDEAEAYRSNVLKYFKPKRGRRPAVIVEVLAKRIFNGDWRHVGKVIHRCAPDSCGCKSREDALQKAQRWGCRLISALGVRLLNRGNWLAWHECLNLLGVLLGMHKLLPTIFSQAISKTADRRGGAAADIGNLEHDISLDEVVGGVGDVGGPVDMDERVQLLRFEQAQHRKDAMSWLFSADGQDPYGVVFKLRVALSGEIKMMADVVELCSVRSKIQQVRSHMVNDMANDSSNSFAMVSLAKGNECRVVLETALTDLTNAALWWHLPHTELEVGSIFRMLLRPAAATFQLVQQQLERYPTRLFRLLGEERRQEAEHVFQVRTCVLDDFSLHFREQYPTPAAILGQEARQTLAAAASMCTGNTFATEVLHSKNARRSRSRHQTHAMTLPTLAYQHLSSSAPDWLQKLVEPEGVVQMQVEAGAGFWGRRARQQGVHFLSGGQQKLIRKNLEPTVLQ